MTYAQVIERLEKIEADLGTLRGETAGREFFTAKRDYEHAWAVQYLKTEGTVEERRQRTVVALYASDAYKAMIVAEGAWEGYRAAQRTLETRASIGQSLLRAMTAEGQRASGPQPSWTKPGPEHFERRKVA